MGRKRAMSLIRVYLLAKTFVFRNEHFQLVFKLKTTLLKIRTRARIYRSSFGHENDRFRENKPNTLVLAEKIKTTFTDSFQRKQASQRTQCPNF